MTLENALKVLLIFLRQIVEDAGDKDLNIINFEEFYMWFVFHQEHDLGSLLKLKSKFVNKVKKWHVRT